MYKHHQDVLDRLAERYREDRDVLALVVVGSVARGDARPDSDVDCMMIVSDEEHRRREDTGQLSFNADDLCDHPGGQAGGGVHPLEYLHRIADSGNEPTRFMMRGARVLMSRVPELHDLLPRCSAYPEAQRNDKMMSFVSQLPVHASYLELGQYSGNQYLLAEAALKIVLFGGRLILAYNRMLFPGRKWFIRELSRATEKPEGMVDRARELVATPSMSLARRFIDQVLAFRDWPQPPEGCWDRFRRDSERNWLDGRGSLDES